MFPHHSTFSSASTEIKQEIDGQVEDPEGEFQDVKMEPEENEENISQIVKEKRIRKTMSHILNEADQQECTNESDFDPEEFQSSYEMKEEECLDENENEIYIKETFSLIPTPASTRRPACEQICSFCNKKFTTLRKLKSHLRIHDKKYKCPHCEYRTAFEGVLKNHELTHTGSKLWRCSEPNCGTAFRQKHALANHEFSVHSKNEHNFKVWRCKLCPFKTMRSRHFTNHVTVTHQGQINSRSSDRKSAVQISNKQPEPETKSQVEPELLLIEAPQLYTQNHSEQQQKSLSEPVVKCFTIFYHCENCDFYTKNHKQVASHLNTQHNLPRVILKELPPGLKTVKDEENKNTKVENAPHFPPRPLRTSNPKKKREREIIPLIQCSQSNCSYSNRQQYYVNCHEFTVHGKRGDFKVHKCPHELCSYETPRAQHIKIHVDAVHKQLKSFSCHLCEYKTATVSNLKNHVENVHYKLKKFSCDFCSFKTGRKKNLLHHVKWTHSQLRQFKFQMY